MSAEATDVGASNVVAALRACADAIEADPERLADWSLNYDRYVEVGESTHEAPFGQLEETKPATLRLDVTLTGMSLEAVRGRDVTPVLAARMDGPAPESHD